MHGKISPRSMESDIHPTLAKFENGKLVKKVNWTPENGTDLDKFSRFLDQIK